MNILFFISCNYKFLKEPKSKTVIVESNFIKASNRVSCRKKKVKIYLGSRGFYPCQSHGCSFIICHVNNSASY
jgi:hypothetical protein